jgi:cytochrome c oxidase subunit 2
VSRWLPENISTYGQDVDSIFYLIYYITSVALILVLGAMVYLLVKYRHREGRKAVYYHGNTTLEIIWTIIPALVFLMLGVVSQRSWATVRGPAPEGSLEVRVVGKQFNWEIFYPGPDGALGTADDVRMENNLHVPVHRPVVVTLASEDVIHSFFLPNARLKQDTLPGREIRVWFELTKTGEFDLPCAELCGFGHGNMLGRLFVHEQGDFSKWASDKRAFPAGV